MKILLVLLFLVSSFSVNARTKYFATQQQANDHCLAVLAVRQTQGQEFIDDYPNGCKFTLTPQGAYKGYYHISGPTVGSALEEYDYFTDYSPGCSQTTGVCNTGLPVCTDDYTVDCFHDSGNIRPKIPDECLLAGYFCDWQPDNADYWRVVPLCDGSNSDSACYNIDTFSIDYPGGSDDSIQDDSLSNPNPQPVDPFAPETDFKLADDSSYPWNSDDYINSSDPTFNSNDRRLVYCGNNPQSSYCRDYNLASDDADFCKNNPSSPVCQYVPVVDDTATSTVNLDLTTDELQQAPQVQAPDAVVEQTVNNATTTVTNDNGDVEYNYTEHFQSQSAELSNINDYLKKLGEWLDTDMGDPSVHDDLIQEGVFQGFEKEKGIHDKILEGESLVGGAPDAMNQLIQSFVPSGNCANLSVQQGGTTSNLLDVFCDKWDNHGGRSALGFFLYVLTAVAIFGVWSSSSKV